MKFPRLFLSILLAVCIAQALDAQAPVMPGANPESLFTSPDPRLNANKQVALHIVRDLLEANHWELAGNYLTERYLQHNPNVASGLAPVMKYFGSRTPSPIPQKMKTPVVAVTAENDLVIVSYAREYADPRHSGQCYTTTWFDMWRIVNGKADEHWDAATIATPGQPAATQPCQHTSAASR